MPADTQGELHRRRTLQIGSSTSLDDVFLPKDDVVNADDEEVDEIDRELEEFKRFCLMNKPLENRPKITVKVNLKDLALKKT